MRAQGRWWHSKDAAACLCVCHTNDLLAELKADWALRQVRNHVSLKGRPKQPRAKNTVPAQR